MPLDGAVKCAVVKSVEIYSDFWPMPRSSQDGISPRSYANLRPIMLISFMSLMLVSTNSANAVTHPLQLCRLKKTHALCMQDPNLIQKLGSRGNAGAALHRNPCKTLTSP
eukprot:1101069-Amphidinium_carterae.1